MAERHTFNNITGGHYFFKMAFFVIIFWPFSLFEFLHCTADGQWWPGQDDWNDRFSNCARIGTWNDFLMKCIRIKRRIKIPQSIWKIIRKIVFRPWVAKQRGPRSSLVFVFLCCCSSDFILKRLLSWFKRVSNRIQKWLKEIQNISKEIQKD